MQILADSKTSLTQPGRGIRKVVDLYHDLTNLLSKARKQCTLDGLSRESIDETDRNDFIGMTEEEIEEERKEYALRYVSAVTASDMSLFPAANGATLR